MMLKRASAVGLPEQAARLRDDLGSGAILGDDKMRRVSFACVASGFGEAAPGDAPVNDL